MLSLLSRRVAGCPRRSGVERGERGRVGVLVHPDDPTVVVEAQHVADVGGGRLAIGSGERHDVLFDDEAVADGSTHVGVRDVDTLVLQAAHEGHQPVEVVLGVGVLFDAHVGGAQRGDGVELLRLEEGEQLTGLRTDVHTPTLASTRRAILYARSPGFRDEPRAEAVGPSGGPIGARHRPLAGMRLEDLDAWATDHHGVITRQHSGLTRSSWYRAIESGHLEQLHPGVARLHGTPPTAEQRIAAAVLAVGGSALASHRSAARLWGVPRPDSDPVDVTVVARRRRPALDGVVLHHPRDLGRLVPQRRQSIPCTNILRTLVDLGAVDPHGVVDAVGHAVSTRLASLTAIERTVADHARRGRSGVAALRAAVDEWSIDRKPADSLLETAMHRLVARYGLPAVEFHPIICGHEVDFRVIGSPVVLECDGWAFHGLQRDTFESDRRRDAELIANGWIVVRFTYRAVTTAPKATADRIAAAVARWS